VSLRLDGLEIPEWAGAPPGQPLSLPLTAIDEDPDQPRHEYDAEALQQLADTIADRGVRQAISVRAHPNAPGRWILNFGSRRLRASKLAGKTEIPAFVDETSDSYDQVIENEQREGLKPLELAMFVQRELKAGRSQADVARRLGKSRAYVTYVCALIDAPDCVMQAYREGKCRGVSELYELRKLHERAPQAAVHLLEGTELLSRRDVVESRSRSVDSEVQLTSHPTPGVAGRPDHPQKLGRANLRSAGRPVNGSASAGQTRPVIELTGLLNGVRMQVVLDRGPEDRSRIFLLDKEGLAQAVLVTQVLELRVGRT
jgi:ParB family chromosome partitioning protein